MKKSASNSGAGPDKQSRMRAEDRRELILDAATQVFGDFGYEGTTTHQVAAAAEVSQPYVVRMFGTKEKLFLDVMCRARDALLTVFREALADSESEVPVAARLGRAYVGLLTNRGLLLSLMHGFVLGKDPEIGPVAREGFLTVYRLLRDEAGFSPSEASQFLAGGMLINTLVGVRMAADYEANADAQELLDNAFPEKRDLLMALEESAGKHGD